MRFVRDEGIVPVGERIKTAAQLACGCWCVADVRTEDEGRTAAEILHRYGSEVGTWGHRSEHAERCKTWLIDHGFEKENGWESRGTYLDGPIFEEIVQPDFKDLEEEAERTLRMLGAVLAVRGPAVITPKHLDVNWVLERRDDPFTKFITLSVSPPASGTEGPRDGHCPGCAGEGTHTFDERCKHATAPWTG